MASYKDVALLNGSLDALSDSLMKDKMMEQQRDLQTQAIGARRDVGLAQASDRSAAAAEKARHDQAMEGNVQAVSDDKRKEATQRIWDSNFKTFGGLVKDGVMDPGTASAALQKAYAQIPDQTKGYIADHPAVQAIESGQPIFQASGKEGFQTQASHNKKLWDAENQKAQDLEDQAKSENDLTSTQRQVMLEQAQKIRGDADTFYKPKQPGSPEDKQTVTVTSKPDGDTGPTVSQRLTPGQYQQQQTATIAQKKAARANAIAKQNPQFTRAQVMQQVQSEFSGK